NGISASAPGKTFADTTATTPVLFDSPIGVAADYFGNVYVSEANRGQIQTVLQNGKTVQGVQTNTFVAPKGLVVSGPGTVLVAGGGNPAQQVRYGEPRIT